MPKVLQATPEIPLEGLSASGFPMTLLRKARSLKLLRHDTYGFQISYTVQAAETSAFQERLRRRYEAVLGMKTLSRDEKARTETLFIQGRWLSRTKKARERAAQTLRSIGTCHDYFVRPPQVVRDKLRISIEGKPSRIRQRLAKFDQLEIPHRVVKLTELVR